MRRTLSAAQVLKVRSDTLQLTGGWNECFGEIERTGIVFFSGPSSSGKSSAALSLLKELARFGRALYLTNEEGYRKTFKDRLRRFGVQEIGSAIQFINTESIGELIERLGKRRAASFILIDSVQDTKMTRAEYERIKAMAHNKMFIFVSRIEGKIPIGRLARQIKYDADIKVWVEGGRAISQGRYIGEVGACDIIEKDVLIHWGSLLKELKNER